MRVPDLLASVLRHEFSAVANVRDLLLQKGAHGWNLYAQVEDVAAMEATADPAFEAFQRVADRVAGRYDVIWYGLVQRDIPHAITVLLTLPKA